jgi:hypothetical protein
MRFLTDGQPKLFKSPTEGMMIITLTGVSFTPNKQLGRRVVDFSATATEFAEATLENMINSSPSLQCLSYSALQWLIQ